MNIGDKFRFIPSGFTVMHEESVTYYGKTIPVEVTGTVVQIHEEHWWFRVRYDIGKLSLHETFKY